MNKVSPTSRPVASQVATGARTAQDRQAAVSSDTYVGSVVSSGIPSRKDLQQVVGPPQGKPKADPNLPADLSDKVGSLDYYRARYEDFKRRHPDLEPPDYYLGYGDKYVRRFSNELRPKLSPEGQKWVDETRRRLQEAIEKKRAEDPAAFDRLERDPEAFRKFAYDTHPDAYLDSGLKNLPPSDLIRIATTPDLKDIVTVGGLKQVAITGARYVGQKVEDGATAVWEGAKSGARWVGEKVEDGATAVWEGAKSGARWVGKKLSGLFDW